MSRRARNRIVACAALTWVLSVAHAAEPTRYLPGRLFYTPTQRSMLLDARARRITERQQADAPPQTDVLRYDGVVLRSDGRDTRWVNGRPERGPATPAFDGLKPGQTRADRRVYEPYQLLRPEPANAPSAPAQ